MIKFTTHEEIEETHKKGKVDIFYKKWNIEYEVRNIGVTVYCHDTEKNLGMGAIGNFDVDGFYGIEKPELVTIESEVIEENRERCYED